MTIYNDKDDAGDNDNDNEYNDDNDAAYDDGWRCRQRWRYNNDEDDAGEPADPPAGDYLLAAERHLSQQSLRTATQGAPPYI